VQRAGDVGRRQQDAEIVGFGLIETGGEVTLRLPERVPAVFYVPGFEGFVEFAHGARFYHSPVKQRLLH
jgi:hypothetical protein